MLSKDQRTTILELHRRGLGARRIAKTLGISRTTVKKVTREGSSEVPPIHRQEKAARYRDEILRLYPFCKGNLQRVHEELVAMGADLSYQALTAFCRRHGIGQEPKRATGEYHFRPGEEIQHDTSPHRATIAGSERRVQSAVTVACFSRMIFFQGYPSFDRFHCKVFLTDALCYYGGVCQRMMIDNTHVVVLRGTGSEMVPVPEMASFADRFGFVFAAHEKGDANRSAVVEGVMHFIENNFYAGRVFSSWGDLNQQAVQWCDRVNARFRPSLRAKPVELWATEKPHLKSLPCWIPEVYQLHHRTVDAGGFVRVNTNRYSVPLDWIGRPVEIRETKDRIVVTLDKRNQVSHARVVEKVSRQVTNPDHRPPRGRRGMRPDRTFEEQLLATSYPALTDYVAALKRRGRKQKALALKQLLRMAREYPQDALMSAVHEAARYGLYDLDRVERMVLRLIAKEYFRLQPPPGDDDE